MNAATNIYIDDETTLELTSVKHAPQLFEAVQHNRAHLSQFLPWVPQMQTVENMWDYLYHCELLYQQKKELSFVIVHNRKVAGRIGLHYINEQNRTAAIGYWLDKNVTGKDIMMNACRALIQHGFEQLQLHRIEIKAATDNVKSRAIPEKLNFTKEGILREAEWVNGTFVDLCLYSMLRHEWDNKNQ